MRDIPFTLFDGEVRSHVPRELPGDVAGAFDRYFPGFRVLPRTRELRFAGDRTIDRSGCFTPVAPACPGRPSTLVEEIEAYRDPACGPARLLDAETDAARIAEFGHEVPAGPGLALIEPDGNCVHLPLRLARLRLEHVIDLRLPATQEWFARTFVALELRHERKRAGTSKPPIDGFAGLLPTLLDPAPGGGPLTRAIGAWLRCHRATALIYPSARTPSGATFEGGALTDFWGSNLLVYLGSTATLWEPLFGLQPEWLRWNGGRRFTAAADGSWRIETAEKTHRD